jgi:hypothetical protein
VRVSVRVRLKGFVLLAKPHQHARAQVFSCSSFLDPFSLEAPDQNICNEIALRSVDGASRVGNPSKRKLEDMNYFLAINFIR